MNSADVGYIIDGIVEDKDAVSLLIYWADQGNISIIQQDEKKLSFEKLKELPETANDYETILFDKMFEKGNKISISDMKYNFSSTIAAVKDRIKDKYEMPENLVFTKKSQRKEKLAAALAPLPVAIAVAFSVYSSSFEEVAAVIGLSLIHIFCWLSKASTVWDVIMTRFWSSGVSSPKKKR